MSFSNEMRARNVDHIYAKRVRHRSSCDSGLPRTVKPSSRSTMYLKKKKKANMKLRDR